MDGWAEAGSALHIHPTSSLAQRSPWSIPWAKVACQALSELVLLWKEIEHCSVKQLKLGVEQLCEYSALLQCSWCELDHKALLQLCFMTPS